MKRFTPAIKTLAILMGAGAVLGLAGCGFLPPSADAKKALAAMALDKSGAGIVTYAKLTSSGSRAEITDAKIMVAEGLEIPVGKIIFKGLDMSAGASPQPGFESMELFDVAYSLAGVPGTSAKLNIKRIYLLDPGPDTAKWAVSLFRKDPDAVFPDIEKLNYKDWRIEGVEGSYKTTQQDASGTFRLASFAAADVQNLNGSRTSMNGLVVELDSAETGRITMNLGEAAAEKPTFKVAKLFLYELFGTGSESGRPLTQTLTGLRSLNHKVVAQFGPLEMGYDQLAFKNFSFSGLGIKGELPSSITTATRDKDGFATGLRTESTPLVLTPIETGRFSEAFKKFVDDLGYSNLSLKYGASFAYDRAADRTSGEKIELILADGATFSVGGSLGSVVTGAKAAAALAAEVEPDAPGSDPSVPEDATPEETDSLETLADFSTASKAERVFLEQVRLETFDFTVTDSSLIDRITQYFAKTGNMPVEDIRKQWLGAISAIKAGPEDPAASAKLAGELRGALESFLNAAFARKPAKLSITMKPAQPLALSDLQSGAFVAKPENLGLKFAGQ